LGDECGGFECALLGVNVVGDDGPRQERGGDGCEQAQRQRDGVESIA